VRRVSDLEIVALRETGLSFRHIARKLKAPFSTVLCRKRKLVAKGLIDPAPTPLGNTYGESELREIEDRYAAGDLARDIAADLGRTEFAVRKMIRKLRDAGVLTAYRNPPPARRVMPSDDDSRDEFADTVYRTVLALPGMTSEQVAVITGYGVSACERELVRLSRCDEPFVKRVRGRGWFAADYVPCDVRER
jgi:DNA-binding Lrp family transcriptional regulator